MQDASESAQAAEQKELQRQQIEERRNHILSQILAPEARERLHRVAMVKPDKAKQVEDMLISMAQTGQLTEKVSEDRLKSLLEQLSEKEKSTKTRITFKRKTAFDDDY